MAQLRAAQEDGDLEPMHGRAGNLNGPVDYSVAAVGDLPRASCHSCGQMILEIARIEDHGRLVAFTFLPEHARFTLDSGRVFCERCGTSLGRLYVGATRMVLVVVRRRM